MTTPNDPSNLTYAVWLDLRREASAVSRAEPFLAPLLKQRLLVPKSFANALASLLADILAPSDPNKDACLALLDEVLSENPQILNDTAKDLIAVTARDPACPTYVHAFLNYKGWQAIQAQRLAHALWMHERRDLSAWIANRVSVVLGPDIHPAARLGAGIMLDHGSGIVIGETSVVEDDVTILQNVTLGGTGKEQGDRHPKVRQGAMIGAGANIIGNIEIGAFSKVGAGSVVLKDVPPGCTMAGVPAQIVRIHSDVPANVATFKAST